MGVIYMNSNNLKDLNSLNNYNCCPNYCPNNHDNYNSIDDAILNICRYNYQYFFLKANVVGIGLGFKISKGYNTFEKCIKVFVSKKYPYYELKHSDLVPMFYKGCKTDIVESGLFCALSLKNRIRPTIGGYSIGPDQSNITGTIACLVTNDKSLYILSNSHVLAGDNTIAINTPILQPSIPDGGRLAESMIGVLSKFIHIKFQTPTATPENEVDCAIARVDYSPIVAPEIAYIELPRGTSSPQLGLPIQRTSRTTEHLNGLIISIGASIIVDFPNNQKALFTNQIITNDISAPGDSGSLLLDNYKKAVGLLCGGSKCFTMYNSINTVLSYLDVKLVLQ